MPARSAHRRGRSDRSGAAPVRSRVQLGDVALELARAATRAEALAAAVSAATRVTSATSCAYYRAEGKDLLLDASSQSEGLAVSVPMGSGMVGRAAASRGAVYEPDLGSPSDVRSLLAMPVFHAEALEGVLLLHAPGEDSLAVDAGTASDLADLLAASLARFHSDLLLTRTRERDVVTLVSHELRTPLTSIIGYSDTILRHHDLLEDRDVLDLVAASQRAAKRLARMVEELLDLAVIESGMVTLQPTQTDVSAFVHEVVTEFAGGRPRVHVDVPDGLPDVTIDAGRMQQVVGNLLANAIQHNLPEVTITVSARVEGSTLVFQVSDDGVGIPEDQRARVFGQFVQVEDLAVRRSGGFGLGLYVVARLTDAMGAEVEIDSAEGKGCTFTVRLPLETTPG